MSCTTYHFENGHFDHVRVGGDRSAPVAPPSAAWSRLYGAVGRRHGDRDHKGRLQGRRKMAVRAPGGGTPAFTQ